MNSHGRIIAEYEHYSIWESPMSEPRFYRPVHILETGEQGSYYFAHRWQIPVSSYKDALLEPEWEIFT